MNLSIRKLTLFTIASSSSMKVTYGFVIIKSQNSIFCSNIILSSSPSSLASSKKKSDDPILRDEWAMDIASMGGDPSFLPDGYNDEDEWYSDDAVEEEEEASMPSMSLLGVAGVPSVLNAVGRFGGDEDGVGEVGNEEGEEEEEEDGFEWDGEVDEDAFFD